jgi:virginiamycin B lyase
MKKPIVTFFVAVLFCLLGGSYLKASPEVALTGTVNSAAEGFMEGVLVSAQGVGGNITVTVATDKTGRYAFPKDRLNPGKYKITIRATGYDSPKPEKVITITPGRQQLNFKLEKTQDLADQMSWAEWLMSIPGTSAQKNMFYACVGCHSPATITKSTHEAAEWPAIIVRMRMAGPAATIKNAVAVPYKVGASPNDPAFGEFLSSINLSHGRKTWDFDLKTLPRPTGKATKAIVTEYDLPRPNALPGDVVRDEQGMIWYLDFATSTLGRVDPRSGAIKEWDPPVMKPGYPLGSLGLELDSDGNPWLARVFQAGVSKFDKKTETFHNYPIPDEYNNDHTRTAMLDIDRNSGKIVFDDPFNRVLYFLNPVTSEMVYHRAYPNYKTPDWKVMPDPGLGNRLPGDHGHFMYGVAVDSKGTGYWADLSGGNIGEMDPKTGETKLYPVPTPNAGPRRMHMNEKDELWIGENYAFKIGMFDTKTKQFKEWDDPTPWNAVYDAVSDKTGYVWAAGWTTGLVSRLNPKTGEIIQYLLPAFNAEIRRVSVDNSGDRPIFWAGENAEPKVVKVEILD